MNKQPNILLMNCDDLGYGDLGCYGSTKNKTPHLDQMAAEGLTLTDFYMASPVCSPSRAAMMTGCYPTRIGVERVLFPGDSLGLSPEETTVARTLKASGYDTKLIGKWHCGDQPPFFPTNHGFDEYYGIPYSNDMGRQASKGGADRPPLPLMRNDGVIQQQPDQAGLTERYVEEAVRFIREKREGPFFLYFAHMYVHVPIFVPERFMKQSDNGPYGAAVEAIDWAMGVLMAELKTAGLDENTLIIFTSDNGSRARDEGGSNAPLRGTKATTWEGGQRVPCIMRWPGNIPAGRKANGLMTGLDFFPTLNHLADASQPGDKPIDGLDMTDFILGKSEVSPRDTFFYYNRRRLHAVRKGPWKLHFLGQARNDEPVKELYHLENDPGESDNRYEQEPEVVKALSQVAEEGRKVLGDESRAIKGEGERPGGHVENPETLTTYDENHPYMVAYYDLGEGRVMAG